MSDIKVTELDQVVVKFAGDSGDGMQLTGTQFTETSALLGNDLATFPDYPAEIRAPQGTLAGVSGFQVHIGKVDINTPGDMADTLVAMNPAALKVNMSYIKPGATIVVDIDNFDKRNLQKAHYDTNPLEDGSLSDYNVIETPISSLTREALSDSGLDGKSINRCKNMFALGLIYFIYSRPLEQTEQFLENKFKKKPLLVAANKKALLAGYAYAETIEALPSVYTVLPASLEKGVYRNIMGNQATAWGFLAASEKSGRELFLGSYPITPASDILHELAKYKHFGAKIFQAEDEIAGVCSTIGASFAGSLAITTTSGPGIALKSEAIGLAVMTELPIVVVNVQRGGPSTGLPTKTEQADLMQVLYGRNGESPAVVIAASSPANCFDWAYESSRIALEHMTPVILLSDGYLGNGSEPWKIKSVDELPDIKPKLVTGKEKDWSPYLRDEETLARTWAIPGMTGFEHRIGGLEKDSITGNVSYDPDNHERMVKIRDEKIARIAQSIPNQKIEGAQEGDLLVVGWGGTYGALVSAVNKVIGKDKQIGLAQFNYINPLPANTAEIFGKFKHILVCELNMGQFVIYLRGKLPQFTYLQHNKVQGMPFTTSEIVNEINKILEA
jgi:2-oxoglutarate/2-oxoacid ferredoxin oxidoreductase subunit alpha